MGVLRWTWRLQYYAIGAFGTDRYPPFTLADDPAYPAHLEVEYPQRLSRGLALVKWWLLAIPQYIIVGVFTGSGLWAAWEFGSHDGSWGGAGLIGLLAVIAAVIMLVTGRYPEQLYDFLLGMNRWVLRVAGYAGLMTDQYPPFRLDMGGHDPGTLTLPPPPAAPVQGLSEKPPAAATAGAGRVDERPDRRGDRWRGPRALLGWAARWRRGRAVGADQPARGLRRPRHRQVRYTVPGYAIASDTIGLHLASGVAADLIGTVRIQVTQVSGNAPAFIGIAPANAAARYLAGVDYATVRGAAGHQGTYTEHAGTAPAVPPEQASIWTAHASGPGTQTLTWAIRSGDWMVVAMNADGSRPVNVQVHVAATLPALPWIAAGLLIGGIVVLVGGVLLIVVSAQRASRHGKSTD